MTDDNASRHCFPPVAYREEWVFIDSIEYLSAHVKPFSVVDDYTINKNDTKRRL